MNQASTHIGCGGTLLRNLIIGVVVIVAIVAAVAYFGTDVPEEKGKSEQLKKTDGGITGPTVENSPGNPKFIQVSFTEDDYKSTSYIGRVTRDTAAVAFLDQGVIVNTRGYNLNNEEDEVIVQPLPTKVDRISGHELHTYNIWLESGQHHFATEVEVTLPIHNGPGALQNVLYHNLETGEWEELYYEVADDGKSCTAYIDHFSEIATEEMTANDLKELGDKLDDVYNLNSLFLEGGLLPCNNARRNTMKVFIVNTPDFKKIAEKQTHNSKGIFEVLRKGGGVPANAGEIEFISACGSVVDWTSAGIAVGQAYNKIGDTFLTKLGGGGLSAVGIILLNAKLMSMSMQGVHPSKISEEMRWGYFNATIGSYASLAALAGFEQSALIFGWAGLLIFAGTTAYSTYEKFLDMEVPFGSPRDVEEGAYHTYLMTPNTTVLKKLGIDSPVPLKGNGDGWAEAIEAVFQQNKGILNAEQMGAKLVELYETYINYFWHGLPIEEKEKYWRKYLNMARYDYSNYIVTLRGLPYPKVPTEKDECDRMWYLYKEAGIKVVDDHPEELTDEGYAKIKRDIRFNTNIVQGRIKDYKYRAMESLAQHTNQIVLDVIKKQYHNNIMDARKVLYNEVLPVMNTMLWFYADDSKLETDQEIDQSLYYGYNPITKKNEAGKMSKLSFQCDRKALFVSRNNPKPLFTLQLQPKLGTPRLLKCTVFHYLQYGAPSFVDVFPPKDSKLEQTTATVHIEAGTPYTIDNEQGFSVPITFEGNGDELETDALDLNMYIYDDDYGIYNPFEIKQKYGSKAKEMMLPANIKVYLMGDGRVSVKIPAIVNYKVPKCGEAQYTISRDALSLSGQVKVKKEKTLRNGLNAKIYIGVFTGNNQFTARWTKEPRDYDSKKGNLVEYYMKFTSKTDINEKLARGFVLYHYTKDNHCDMFIGLKGSKYEENYYCNRDPKSRNLPKFNYEFRLTSDIMEDERDYSSHDPE